MRTSRSGGRAFTLIELLVVIAVIVLLVGILLPALAVFRQAAGGWSLMLAVAGKSLWGELKSAAEGRVLEILALLILAVIGLALTRAWRAFVGAIRTWIKRLLVDQPTPVPLPEPRPVQRNLALRYRGGAPALHVEGEAHNGHGGPLPFVANMAKIFNIYPNWQPGTALTVELFGRQLPVALNIQLSKNRELELELPFDNYDGLLAFVNHGTPPAAPRQAG